MNDTNVTNARARSGGRRTEVGSSGSAVREEARRLSQGLIEVGDEVSGVFQTDRQPQHAARHAGAQLLVCVAPLRRQDRHADQAFEAAEAGGALDPAAGRRRARLAAKSIGYSRGCSGTNVGQGIAQLGLTEKLKAKRTVTTAGPVTDYLARGDFEIGIQQTNIMVGVPGTDDVGPLPGFLNKPCPSSVAGLPVSKEQDAARAMIRFMISPGAAPLLRKTHVEPAKP